jgi:PAS domain S-box-containing protein
MTTQVISKKQIGLVSLDLPTEVVVIRELRQLGYIIKRIDGNFSNTKATELSAIDLIVGIPSESFDESEFQTFLSGVAGISLDTPSIITSRSSSIKHRLKAYQSGISSVLDARFIKKNIQHTVESILASNKDKKYRALIVSDCNDDQLPDAQILEGSDFIVSLIDDPMQIEFMISKYNFEVILFQQSKNYCICEYLKALKEIEKFKHISLIAISNETSCDSTATCFKKYSDACLSYPFDKTALLKMSLSCAKKSNVLKLRDAEFKRHYYEREREHEALDKHALVSVADVKGNITYVNDLFCQTSGYDAVVLLGNNHRLIKSNHHTPEFFDEIWSTISKGNTWQGEICNLHSDGTEYWVETTITGFLDTNGEPYQYTAIRTDITGQKLAQIKLSSTLAILEKTNKAANMGFWEFETKTNQFIWSSQTRVIHEVSSAYEPSLKTALDFYVEGPFRKNMAAVFKRATLELIPFDQEFVIQTEKGNKRWVRVVGVPEEVEGGCDRIHGLFQDITEKKNAILDLLIAKEDAESASLAKTKFLAQMSHELRTPLNAILGFSQLLNQSDGLTSDQCEDVGEILLAGGHLLKLVNEVLDLSAVEAGRISFSFEPVNLEVLIKECCQLVAPLAANYQLKVTCQVPENLFVKADRVRLKQVAINLINNGIKYNRNDGFVIIRASIDDHGCVMLEVENSGVSIPSNKISEVFRPFVRLNSSAEGTGVGLSVCKHLVSLMGGNIGIREGLVDRNIFWVRLPRDYPNEGLHSSLINSEGSEPKLAFTKPKKILYVEDNPVNLKLVANIMSRRKGVHFYTAHTPKIGLELARQHSFDVILLDINLPGMNGFELMAKLKRVDGYNKKPFVAISANAMPEDIEKAKASGFTAYITKPMDVCEFNQRIDELFA